MEHFREGAEVMVTCYGGQTAIRRVIADSGKTVTVCNEGEYEKATKANRKPEGIGFPKALVQARAALPRR